MMNKLASSARGAAAVEMAVILPVMVLLIAFPLLFGRIFWHYAVIQSAAYDAARYLSSVPIAEMTSQTRGIRAADLAHDIAAAETAELVPGEDYIVSITVTCNDGACDVGVPATVTILVRVRMYDPFFNGFTWGVVGDEGLLLQAKVTMRYVGQ